MFSLSLSAVAFTVRASGFLLYVVFKVALCRVCRMTPARLRWVWAEGGALFVLPFGETFLMDVFAVAFSVQYVTKKNILGGAASIPLALKQCEQWASKLGVLTLRYSPPRSCCRARS
jgi:hypothetical protein